MATSFSIPISTLLSAVMIAALGLSSSTFAYDVIDGSSEYVEVLRKPNNMIRFRFCDKETKKCRPIAKREFHYDELVEQAKREEEQFGYSILADVLIVVATAGTAAYYVGGTIITSAPALFAGAGGASGAGGVYVATGAAAGSAAYKLTTYVNALNPLQQLAQAEPLSEAVLSDQEVKVQSVRKFTTNLRQVLEKIE